MSNVYYNPEAYGLEVVFTTDKSDGCYQFDMFVIWKHSEGRYYWGSDAGCSCPSPFEESNLSNLTMGSLRDAINDCQVWIVRGMYGDGTPDQDERRSRADAERFRDEQGL